MPFSAMNDGERVLPHQVTAEASLTCPKCSDNLTVVTGHHRNGRFVARHFRHQTNEDCAGESIPHLRMKLIALSKLKVEFPNATVSLEKTVGNRRADLLVEFNQPRHPFGHGIAVEVQYRNNSKDLFATDSDYYDQGFSVLWLSEQHYSGYDVSVNHVQHVWPRALPKLRGYDGLQLPICEPPESVEVDIILPREYFEANEAKLKRAYQEASQSPTLSTPTETSHREKAVSGNKSSSWVTHKQVWLSKKADLTKRSLQFVESPTGQYFLKLSKGQRGTRPESILVRVTPNEVNLVEKIPSTIQSAAKKEKQKGEWQDLDICWLKSYESSETAWFKIKSSRDNQYVMELGQKDLSGNSEIVKTKFSISGKLHHDIEEFVNNSIKHL
ncbi:MULTISPECIES: competence protein CoiA family protein [unclassified Haloferax]|uniref:competence protein CoiA family protein n=2 Tax=Haloferax TaxID=2251 RepID=UPI00287B9006|nr:MULTISPECIES: competence protein CoiA family protein [unclassified Haloferax]